MRVAPALIRQAAKLDRFLPFLLAGVKDIEQAQQELRWLRERFHTPHDLARACWLRSHSYPLQYILGSQPFLSLDIICRRGVLIPRWETEEWCLRLTSSMKRHSLTKNLKVVDLCTGTGCIALSVAAILSESKVVGVDKSPEALRCFADNVRSNKKKLEKRGSTELTAINEDVLDPENAAKAIINKLGSENADLVLANPPYINPDRFQKDCERSVISFEPHTALIGGNEFYQSIVDISKYVGANAFVCEVGDHEQMDFVREYATKQFNWSTSFHLDSTGKPRAVTAWNPDSKWKFLAEINKHFNIVEQEVDSSELD